MPINSLSGMVIAKGQCTFTNQAFDGLIAVLKLKKDDTLISGMDITPERSKQVSFTQPYYASSLADLASKKLSMENGTTHQKYIQDAPPEINIVSFNSYHNAILELKNGRIDGLFGDTAVVNE